MSGFKTVYTAEQIHERVGAIAARIAEDYKDCKLVFVGILKGAAFLLADLARLYPGPVDWEMVDVTTASGDRVSNTTIGDSLCLLAVDETNWIATQRTGTWTDAD